MKQKWRGDGYIDTVIFFLVVIICLALIVNVLPVFSTKQDLDHFAKALAREVEIVGDSNPGNTDLAGTIADLEESTGLEPEITIVADRYVSGTRIQIDTNFTVTCTLTTPIGGFGGFDGFAIPLTGQATGRSEQYWK